MSAPSTPPTKLRVRFSKQGKIRFTSHRDVARIWERALRRAGIPVAYTEGFSPRPKLSFGLALSTGHESLGEYLDVNARDAIGPDELVDRVNLALPYGMEAQVAEPLEAGADSLQQAVTSCTWHFELPGLAPAVVARTLATDEIVLTRERKGHALTEDIRPCILALRVLPPGTGFGNVEAELATQPRSLRPAELVSALDPALQADRVVRIHQWTLVGGARQEVIPLPPVATLAPHAQARAS